MSRRNLGMFTPQVIGAIVLAFLLLPIFAVVPASFTASSFIKIPPQEYSTRWYVAFLGDQEWIRSVFTSVEVALFATTLSLVIGTLAALGLARATRMTRSIVTGLMLVPMIVPVIMTSIALYYMMRLVGLQGSVLGLALAHTLLCLPFVVLNIGVSLARFDQSLLRAATGLGAGHLYAFRTVTMPAIKPGLFAGAAFAFITSFDEVVVSTFLAGTGAKTLPIKLFEQIRVEFTPVAAVGSTAILAVTIVLFGIVQFSRRKGQQTNE